MENNVYLNYETPFLNVVDVESEGVLCNSNESVFENEGVW